MFRLVADTITETLGAEALDVPENAALTGEDFSYFAKASIIDGLYRPFSKELIVCLDTPILLANSS